MIENVKIIKVMIDEIFDDAAKIFVLDEIIIINLINVVSITRSINLKARLNILITTNLFS